MTVNVLGINYYFHDSSACLVRDGQLVAAVEEERLIREKHTSRFPERAAEQVLRLGGLDYGDVEHVAVGVSPGRDWQRKLAYALCHPRRGGFDVFRHELDRLQRRQRALFGWLRDHWPLTQLPKVHFVPHHLAHAGGSFYASPYEEAALLALDGSGEWASSFLGAARGGTIQRYNQSYFPMSLGSFYEAVTEYCGFRPNYDEGKTMGLAPYGDPARFGGVVEPIVRVDDDGGIHIDLDWFDYPNGGESRCGKRLLDALGPARAPGAELEERHRDAAAAFQRVLEERVLTVCRMLRRRSGCRRLVLSGGVALNSVMNGRIVRESGFDDIYVMPGAGDDGTSIGAALWVHHHLLGHPRRFVHDNPYLGEGYSNDAIGRALDAFHLRASRRDDLVPAVAQRIHDGRIVGWFQGRMEFGPRALGARSILATPVSPQMKATLNARVKHREPFRPFAPSVMAERKSEFFATAVDDPFMLKVCQVRPEYRSHLPAITHVDGSARLQTVHRDTHPRYHQLLAELGERSGFPVVLNTSFNVMGEPIVESPRDAVHCFLSTDIDTLAIGDYLVDKAR